MKGKLLKILGIIKMKLITSNILYIDFVDKDSKNELDEKLRELTERMEEPKQHYAMAIPGSSSVLEDWGEVRVPSELTSVFKSIKVEVTQFGSLPFAYAVIINGVLTAELKDKIWTSSNDSEVRNLVYNAREQLVKFLKPRIPGILCNFDKQIAVGNDALTLLLFNIQTKDVNEIIDLEKGKLNEDVLNKVRENKLPIRLGANPAGLLSLYRLFRNHVTILAQAGAVYDNYGYSCSSFSILEFSDTLGEMDMIRWMGVVPIDRFLQLLLQIYWQRTRLVRVQNWKSRVEKLTNTIREMESSIEKLNLQKLRLPISEQKGVFLGEYAKVLDECRSAESHVKFEKKLSEDEDIELGFWKEIPIPIRGPLQPIRKEIFEEMRNYVALGAKRVKEEYTILRRQYDVLSSHMRDLINLALAQANLKLASTNTKIQWIMLILTIAIFLNPILWQIVSLFLK